jgi:hypothetical protein
MSYFSDFLLAAIVYGAKKRNEVLYMFLFCADVISPILICSFYYTNIVRVKGIH